MTGCERNRPKINVYYFRYANRSLNALLTGVGHTDKIIVIKCRSFSADLPLDKLQKFYNNFVMAVSNWTGHERVIFFRHAEYKQTCSRQTPKKRAIKHFDAFK